MRNYFLTTLCLCACVPMCLAQSTQPAAPFDVLMDRLVNDLNVLIDAYQQCAERTAACEHERDALLTAHQRAIAEHAAQTAQLNQQIADLLEKLAGQRPALLPWPSPAARIIVNGYPYLESRPRGWFPSDPAEVWVVDFATQYPRGGNPEPARLQVEATRESLRRRGWTIGRYISSTNIVAAADLWQYPPNAVTKEDFAAGGPAPPSIGTWPGQPWRTILDVTDEATARRQAQLIGASMEGFRLALLDNCPPHRSTFSGAQDWTKVCRFLRLVADALEQRGTRGFFNLAVHVGTLTPDERAALIAGVRNHAIVLEVPFHENVRASPTETAKATAAYRAILDAGIPVVMLTPRRKVPGPSGTQIDETDAALHLRVRQLHEWVQSWRRPTDRVYVVWSFLQPPPEWMRTSP